MSKPGRGPQETVVLGIAVTVCAVWTIASLVQLAFPDRTVPTYVNIIMAAVVGSLFGAAGFQLTKRNGKAGDDE